MTAPDFPAAHSMDTVWFAVDEAGHVAAFDTGEDGVAPVGAEDAPFLLPMYLARHPEVDPNAYHPTPELAAGLGFFLYEYRKEAIPIDVFDRRVIPERPAHVEELPPEVRAFCKRIRLPVSFAAADRVQPFEFRPCTGWAQDGWIGFLAADGVTVRPIPGREARFADFITYLRAEYPDEAARYHFEGVDDGR